MTLSLNNNIKHIQTNILVQCFTLLQLDDISIGEYEVVPCFYNNQLRWYVNSKLKREDH